ncbi:uncharacterized protein LOC112904727 [Agrilus planipennis]|uniref:Uncharacterized protein LOC112904727 n=1 Tax=Agrilus planipennis TaxID=224129 RepID=A0A7F5R5Z5_AGRPL|nr:uncharacterized protein LOC112904727 [Agrilus planipennis]
MAQRKDYQLQLIETLYNKIPAFTDIFTEETFYMTAAAVVVSTFVVVFILSRYITIKPVDI